MIRLIARYITVCLTKLPADFAEDTLNTCSHRRQRKNGDRADQNKEQRIFDNILAVLIPQEISEHQNSMLGVAAADPATTASILPGSAEII
jgi:hypothetical protein